MIRTPYGWRGGDHPRSRGVYRPSHSAVATHHRIIPARAGFTRCGAAAPSSRGDHPRSRGVYVCHVGAGRFEVGSSPLARGLPLRSAVAADLVGIIPARAGFTHIVARAAQGDPDHPRSRGVYDLIEPQPLESDGSSPLARGLRHVEQASNDASWIIPARAGFTPLGTPHTPLPADHPRSRGVYQMGRARVFCRAGSSPLARGLPLREEDGAAAEGIIPARAGFTDVVVTVSPLTGDHPRSRGVYQVDRPGVPQAPGIIPARAGFTSAGWTVMPSRADHPRSRGVYGSCGRGLWSHGGSSPLARGLPWT